MQDFASILLDLQDYMVLDPLEIFMAGAAFAQGHGRVSLSQIFSLIFRIRYLKKQTEEVKRVLLCRMSQDDSLQNLQNEI
jgi:hypothetical protein